MIGKRRLSSLGTFVCAALLSASCALGQAQEARKLLKKVDPVYPELAQRMNLRGTVKVEVSIAANGAVENVTVLGGNPVLAAAVTDAVKQRKYASGPEEVKRIEFKF